MPKYQIVLQALSPIAHGDTVPNDTNTRLFMRQNQLVNGYAMRVPAISENSLRTTMFRTPLHDDLLERIGTQKSSLLQSVVNLLYSGGGMKSGAKSPSDEMRLGHELKQMYPSLDLLGGSVDNFILPKGRLKLNAWIVAKENQQAIDLIAPELSEEASRNSAFDLVSEEVRTRGTGKDTTGNQMIFQYETLAAGAKILVEVNLDPHTPETTLACLKVALDKWDGFIGGRRNTGRGKMVVVSHNLPDSDAYLAHIEQHKEEIINGLLDGTFATNKELCS